MQAMFLPPCHQVLPQAPLPALLELLRLQAKGLDSYLVVDVDRSRQETIDPGVR